MQIRMNRYQRCTHMLLALFLWLVPITIYAQTPDQVLKHDSENAPKIIFESQTHDFGTVKPKTSLTHEFTFKNQGTAKLLIEKVKAG
jgi:hypothetical protein